MTKSERDRFQAILTAKVAELERFTRHREGITIERSADQMEEIQTASERALAVCNLDREFNQLRNVRAALEKLLRSGDQLVEVSLIAPQKGCHLEP